MNQVFVYDDLLIKDTYQKLRISPVNERLAETTGKLYMINKVPVMLLPNEISIARSNRRVIGAIYTFNKQDMPQVLDTLDAYKLCSMSRIGMRNPMDLTYRAILQVYPITFNNIHELTTFRYKYLEAENCYVYLGNVNNKRILNCVLKDRHKKLSEGCYKQGLQNILNRLDI